MCIGRRMPSHPSGMLRSNIIMAIVVDSVSPVHLDPPAAVMIQPRLPHPNVNVNRFSWVWATTWWGNAHGSCGPDGCSSLDPYKFDFAVVRLALPIGQLVGWLGLKYELKKQGYSVTSAG